MSNSSTSSSCQGAGGSALRYVACVSYPRSGHHLTVRMLRHYFRNEFNYCQFYNRSEQECCQSFPCTNESVTMTKNHDMELNRNGHSGLPKVAGVPYLILIRNFLEAVVSDYNLFLRDNEDSLAAWESFSLRKATFYKRFVQKWVLSDDALDKLVVQYENLTTKPVEEFTRVLSFFHPTGEIDGKRLKRIINDAVLEDVRPTGIEVIRNFGVRNRRRVEDFKYFDPQHFARLEEHLKRELAGLGYPLRFAVSPAKKAS